MKIMTTDLPDVLVLEPVRHGDSRGFFSESWNAERMAEAGLDIAFVQDNHSFSHKKGTLRGLHYQAPPHAQGKLVRCGRGRLWDVAVDFRFGSPAFGRWYAVELSFDNGLQLWIPPGFLHGFVTQEPDTEIIYKCTDHYAPECDAGVRWNDPDIAIDWPVDNPLLSQKDTNAPLLREIESPFLWEMQS